MLHVIWLFQTDIFDKNVTICIGISCSKIVLIFPVGYHNNFFIVLRHTIECLTLKLLI